MAKRTDRHTAETRGRTAEWLAALYLNAKFYFVLERRYRTPVGEIDLIVRRGRLLVFVEVKARRDRDEAIFAVSARSQQRIRRAAEFYLAAHPGAAHCSLRFDVVALVPRRLPRHIVDAFAVDR